MKTLVSVFLFSFILLGLTSCFEVREEITLKKDGSGRAFLLVNLSESKETLANFMRSGEYQGEKLPSAEEVKQKIEEAAAILSGSEGITNVSHTADMNGFVFSMSCDFSEVPALNKAINTMAREMNDSRLPVEIEDNFSYSPGSFSRLFDYELDPIPDAEYKQLNSMYRYAMETARLVQIYRFAQPVKKFSNQNAKLSPSGTAVKVEHTISDLVRGKSTIENEISF